jgi:O-antigen/teichoic acid export membrane protein
MITRGLEIFSETGFGAALVQQRSNFEEARDTAFTMMVIRGILLAGVAVLIAPLVAKFYGNVILEPVVAVISVGFLLSAFQNMNSILLQRDLDFKPLVYVEVSTGIIGFIVSVGLAYYMRNVWSLVFAQLITSGVGVIMSFIIVPGRPKFGFNKKVAGELFHYGKFITGLTVVIFITVEIDKAVIGKVLGIEALGYYTLAYTIANIPSTYISKIVSKVMFPVYSMLQGDPVALRAELSKAIYLVAAVAIPASAGISALAPDIVRICYGEKWLPASSALSALALFGCFRALGSVNGYLYNGIGKPGVPFYSNLAKLIVIVISIYPLTKMFGIVGAAAAVVVPIICQYIVEVAILERTVGLSVMVSARPIVIGIAQSGVMLLVVLSVKLLVKVDSIVGLFLLMALGGVVMMLLNLHLLRSIFTLRLSQGEVV